MPILENEKELENYLLSVMSANSCCPLTYDKVDFAYNQVGMGEYGIADIITISSERLHSGTKIIATIYELKKGVVDLLAINQIARYYRGFLTWLDTINAYNKTWLDVDVRGVLVGNHYAKDDSCYLANSINWLSVFMYKIDLSEGLSFEEDGTWTKIDEDFNYLNSKLSSCKEELLESISYTRKR